jgi:hypothetical protein
MVNVMTSSQAHPFLCREERIFDGSSAPSPTIRTVFYNFFHLSCSLLFFSPLLPMKSFFHRDGDNQKT